MHFSRSTIILATGSFFELGNGENRVSGTMLGLGMILQIICFLICIVYLSPLMLSLLPLVDDMASLLVILHGVPSRP